MYNGNNRWKGVVNKNRFKKEFDPRTDEIVNNYFKVGISISSKIKLYENFDAADIIVASPMGLRLVVGQEGEEETRREYNFLSSIQTLILDQAEVFIF